MTARRVIVNLLLLATLSATAAAQEAEMPKREVERSVDADELPGAALAVLEEVAAVVEAADYYRETDGEVVSFEAKLQARGYLWSVEFFESGRLMNVEQLIPFDEIPGPVRTRIERGLDSLFARHTLTRIQRQYTPEDEDDDEDLLEDLLEREGDDDEEDLDALVRYELEANARDGDVLGAFELTFDADGRLVQQRRIIRRPLDNLLY
jgi:hypothetical protein